MRREKAVLEQVLRDGAIRSVYQPIVSLRSGEVYAYEALIRITLPDCPMNIEKLFRTARRCRKLWELKKLCRGQEQTAPGAALFEF